MQWGLYLHVLWRSAFQARRTRRAYPRTSYPVTIASLCTAFQALVLTFYCPMIREIRGQKYFVDYFYCARKRQLQVVSSCSCCRHIQHLIALVQIRATDPVAILSLGNIRVNSCNSWAKKYFPKNSWTHTRPVIQKFFSPPIRVFYPQKTRQPSTYSLNSLIHSR